MPVITGIGVLSPTGIGAEEFWTSVIHGVSGIRSISRFVPSPTGCQIAGQVDDGILREKLDARTLRTTTHATQLALIAASESLADANIGEDLYPGEERGVYVGTAVGGWAQGEQQYGILLEKGSQRINPFVASGAPNYSIGAEVALLTGARGAHLTCSTGCPSSLQAIGHAAVAIVDGDIRMSIAGGTESPITPVVVASLSRSTELSQGLPPQSASRPFDRRHEGMVLSEGSCFLVLESEESATARGAEIYAEVLGSTTSCDARGLYQIDPTGEAGARAIHRLLRRTGVGPGDIDYVCAHANSSPAFDRKEILVLKKAFGEFAARMPISSIKGVLGHPFGASGAFQTAVTALAMRHGLIPPNHNLEDPDPECDLDLVTGKPRPANIRHALITSYGYGGINSYLLLRRCGSSPV